MAIFRDRAEYAARETDIEMRQWLAGGATRADGRLALFDSFGEPVNKSIVKQAIANGLAEPWFASPMRPQWTVCRLTQKGRAALDRQSATR